MSGERPVNAEEPDWVCFTRTSSPWPPVRHPLDALAHSSYGGVIYNGYRGQRDCGRATRCGSTGSPRWSARHPAHVAAPSGATCSSPGTRSARDLDAACELAGAPSSRATSCCAHGQMVHLARAARPAGLHVPLTRLTMETAEWFHAGTWPRRHGHAPLRGHPSQREDAYLPVHLLHLVNGHDPGPNWCSTRWPRTARGRSLHFLLDATPLPLTEGSARPSTARAQVAPRRRAVEPPAPVRCAPGRLPPRIRRGAGRPVTAQ